MVEEEGLRQAILVADQRFALLDLFTVGVEPMQILDVGAPRFRQQRRVNGACRSRHSPMDHCEVKGIKRARRGVSRTRRGASLSSALGAPERGRRQQARRVPYQAAQAPGGRWAGEVGGGARVSGVCCSPPKSHRLPQDIIASSFYKYTVFLSTRALLLCRSKRDALVTCRVQKPCQEKMSFLQWSSSVEDVAFPGQFDHPLSQSPSGSDPVSRGSRSMLT
jgi:hypothetical protein